MKTIAIIGSTGSIGVTALKVIKKYSESFKIIFLYAGKNYKKLNAQFKTFKPKFIFLNEKKFLKNLKAKKKNIISIENFLKKKKKIDYIISAISGFKSLDLNFKLIKICKNLLIANKETIICGGNIFLGYAKKYNCKILPIDSEHFCINYFINHSNLIKKIKSVYLTASGGPFIKKLPSPDVSIKKVLKHPNWKMGKKISVNSANLTNKILELFEARILFKIPIERLNIKIEKTSKIHCVISLLNGLDFYISHQTNMKIPIENSLIKNNFYIKQQKNLSSFKKLNFELLNPNQKIFPILKTGFKVLKFGHRAMIIFTVLNDRLVEKFLNNEKKFNDIVLFLNKKFQELEIVNYSKKSIKSLQDIQQTIEFAEKIKI